MKRTILKCILYTIVSLVVILLLLPALLYVPAIQQGIAQYATRAASEQTGMQIELERVRLRFPLDIELSNALVVIPPNDTMLQCESLVLELGFKKIFQKEIEIENLSFEKTKFHYVDSLKTFDLKVNVDELGLKARPVSLINERATLPDVSLTGGDVILNLVSTPEDTTETSPSTFAWAFEVANIHLKDISYVMTTKPHVTSLQSAIDDAHLSNAVVDIGKQQVTLSSAKIDGALCKYLSLPASESKDDLQPVAQGEVLPWVINVDTLSLAKSKVTYGKLDYLPVKHFDPSYLSLYDLNINAEDIYNKAMEVAVKVNHLSFHERSGFAVSHANMSLLLDSSNVLVDNLYLATQNSTLQGSLKADASILEQSPYANLSLNMNLSLSMFDAPYFVPTISNYLPLLPTSKVNAKIDVGGNLSMLHLKKAEVALPDNLEMELSGDIANILNSQPLKARASINGKLINGELLQAFIGDKDSSSLIIPDNIALNGRVELKGDTLRPAVNIALAEGSANVSGEVNLAAESYGVDISVNKFPLQKLFKDVPLGNLTTLLTAKGVKFNPMQEGATSNILLKVDSLYYNRYDYTDIKLKVALSDGIYNGSIVSNCQDAKMSLTLQGLLSEQKQTLNLNGDIPNLNLQNLNFSNDNFSLVSSVDISASADTMGVYAVKGGIGKTVVRMYGAKRTLQGLNMDISADTTQINANVEAQGLYLSFFSPQSLDNFISAVDSVIVEAKNQTDSLKFNIDQIKAKMPSCTLSFSLEDNPIVSALLKRNGITLGQAQLDFASNGKEPIYLKSGIYSLKQGEASIDSICANLNQNTETLEYELLAGGVKSGETKGGSIKLFGVAVDNSLTINCLQTDSEQNKGFDFGGRVLVDSTSLAFSMITPKPILGYREFIVNDGNYIALSDKERVEADFVLTSGEKLVSLQSGQDTTQNQLFVKLQQLDIASMLKLYPLSPKIEGVLSADLGLNINSKHFGVKGDLRVDTLVYEDGNVGDLNLKAGYVALEEGGQRVALSLNLNDKEVVKLGGKYNTSSEGGMKLKLSIDELPLLSVNPFIPADLLKLTGELNGDFSLDGSQEKINMDGFLQFQDVDMTLPSIGTTFTLSPEKITMKDNTITMYNFGMSGPNKQPMLLEGSIALGDIKETLYDFGKIRSDILITASEFQLINVKKNNKTLVYGKAFSDMFLVIQGYLNNLTLGGNVALLNGTELTYTMRDGGMAQQEDVSSLVTFTAFNDTINQDEVEVKQNVHWGVDMSVGISIGQAVKVAVNLTPDAKSGIDIQGGGELLYTMNMLGDTQFTGKYNIMNGTVRYSLPVVATKVFTIDDGSYIEWNGDIADPTMNITAQNKVRATVNQGGVSNMVNFYVQIGIKNTLEDLDLTFDLTAPEDMTISNELASMSEDQRSEQALSMLLYNTYTGVSGTESNFDANTALGSFLSKELNQWANKTLKNVDLTFGVDSYTSAAGESSLDYSYEFSKSLLNDRLKVSVGGSYNPDLSPDEVAQSILGDVSLEYQLDSRDNMLLKLFRSSTNDILEGNISEYGVGFAVRKQVVKLKELFQITGRKEKVAQKRAEKQKAKETKEKSEEASKTEEEK